MYIYKYIYIYCLCASKFWHVRNPLPQTDRVFDYVSVS